MPNRGWPRYLLRPSRRGSRHATEVTISRCSGKTNNGFVLRNRNPLHVGSGFKGRGSALFRAGHYMRGVLRRGARSQQRCRRPEPMSSSSPTDRIFLMLSERIGSMFARARHQYLSPTESADISSSRECRLANGASWRKRARNELMNTLEGRADPSDPS
jgi:hypothetical protein